MRWLTAGAVLVLAALLLGYNAGDGDSDAAQVAAERTERTRVEQAAITERAYISSQQIMWLATERESTMRLMIVMVAGGVVLVGAVAVAGALVLVTLRSGQVDAQDDRRYLLGVRRQLPAGWRVVDDPAFGWIATDGQEYMLATDVRGLLEAEKRR